MGQLNAELAVQVHSLCIKNNVKRLALRRLYGGLRLMTLLITGIAALFMYAAWANSSGRSRISVSILSKPELTLQRDSDPRPLASLVEAPGEPARVSAGRPAVCSSHFSKAYSYRTASTGSRRDALIAG